MCTDPIESSDYLGFYKINGFPNYLISKDGEVLNIIRNSFLTGSINPAGYLNFRISNYSGTHTWGLHRLLCYVFKHPNKSIINLAVNHIDGIKGNNNLDNLEWVTPQENQEHAGATGLTTKCLSVSIRNIKTNEVLKFPSIVKCANYLGVSKDTVNWRVKAGEHRVFHDGYQYRFGNTDDEWVTPDTTSIDFISRNKSKPVVIRFLLQNTYKFFCSSVEAAKELNVSFSTISNWLSLKCQPVLPGAVQIKYLFDKTPWREVNDVFGELRLFSNARHICVTHAVTGEEKIFTSGIECCKEMNLKPTALNYRLKHSNRVYCDGYRYSYFDAI